MDCYDHPSVIAVGLCKNCMRALCPESAADVGDGLACRGRCEERVRLDNLATRRGIAQLQDAPRHAAHVAIIFGAFGLLAAFVGLATLRTGAGFFALGLGVFALALAATMYTSGRRMRRAAPDPAPAPVHAS